MCVWLHRRKKLGLCLLCGSAAAAAAACAQGLFHAVTGCHRRECMIHAAVCCGMGLALGVSGGCWLLACLCRVLLLSAHTRSSRSAAARVHGVSARSGSSGQAARKPVSQPDSQPGSQSREPCDAATRQACRQAARLPVSEPSRRNSKQSARQAGRQPVRAWWCVCAVTLVGVGVCGCKGGR
jgi:hypothetical protein